MIALGIILFAIVVAFYFVTLPVEFNASARACEVLENSGYFADNEIGAVKSVLSAAAMTYLAALATAVLNLIRLLILRERD